ncbi:hypothetical protein K2173_022394 [Erythroxylum novogranatense]|uniref:Uncharacterized protein n=1 Tax=Erythroxylum novogranatense TaxID=1862640 RepID=A0AAV8TJY9_9ROSI|nr:hypothetical protein K2173_022394 [Erythroxylum novogranatense]
MASTTAKIVFRLVAMALLFMLLFYIGRPLYWKISATVQEIRENKRTVKQGLSFSFFNIWNGIYVWRCMGFGFFLVVSGISQIVYEAQKSVGWFHDDSDSGARDSRRATNMRRLRFF